VIVSLVIDGVNWEAFKHDPTMITIKLKSNTLSMSNLISIVTMHLKKTSFFQNL